MNKIVEWGPDDYAPTYKFEVDEKGDFVKLLKIFDIPTGYPGQKEIPIADGHVTYISGVGFEKYKKWCCGIGWSTRQERY